jgi:hypothetical protein
MEYQRPSGVWNLYLYPLVTNFVVRALTYHVKFVSLL